MARNSKNHSELLQTLREQLNQCAGWEGDKIASDRRSAWNYYHQRKRGDEIAGRSSIVAGDVSAMVEAVLSQMDDAFSTDSLVEFEAYSAEDEDQAQLESDIVCKAVAQNNGLLEILSAIKSGLLLRNGIVKVWVDVHRQTETREMYEVAPAAFAELIQPQPGFEIKVVEYDQESGDLELDVTRVTKRLMVDSIPIANFFYPADLHTLDLQKASFCAERHVDSRSSLIRRGFPKEKVNKLYPFTSEMKVDLNAQSPGQIPQTQLLGIDKSQDFVEWYECYPMMDDGSGESSRRCISISLLDSVILKDEPVAGVPYAAGAVFINPNRFTGISLYDKLKQVQDIDTGLGRALLDNVNTVNKNRVSYLDGVVNSDDITDGRTNGAIRVRSNAGVVDVRAAVAAFTIPDISQGVLLNMENQRQSRSEMGGAALTLATGELQLGDRAGSQGIDRAYSVMEQLSSHMTKVIAKTLIRSLYLLAHDTMRLHFDFPVSVKQGGRWRSSTPSEWTRRDNVWIKPGMSPGERTRRVGMLSQMMDKQIALASQGMDEVLVNLDGFYSTMVDWARAGDIQNPERYVVDPQSPAAQKALQQKQAAQAETAKAQQNLITQAISLEQIRSAIEKYKTDVETQFDYYNANLQAQIEEAKIAGSAALSLIQQMNTPQEGPSPEDSDDEDKT